MLTSQARYALILVQINAVHSAQFVIPQLRGHHFFQWPMVILNWNASIASSRGVGPHRYCTTTRRWVPTSIPRSCSFMPRSTSDALTSRLADTVRRWSDATPISQI
ncbi:hypothetical protein GGR57DRAFT_453165 [Xylariaceae sp. FL1272]|nr:hypothetical protein GGR57DRAFT_453165 [Xylariaceae sp. FL1272]